MNAQQTRLQESRNFETPWKKWGPYVSERLRGTVPEDYSEDGNAWNYFSHDPPGAFRGTPKVRTSLPATSKHTMG